MTFTSFRKSRTRLQRGESSKNPPHKRSVSWNRWSSHPTGDLRLLAGWWLFLLRRRRPRSDQAVVEDLCNEGPLAQVIAHWRNYQISVFLESAGSLAPIAPSCGEHPTGRSGTSRTAASSSIVMHLIVEISIPRRRRGSCASPLAIRPDRTAIGYSARNSTTAEGLTKPLLLGVYADQIGPNLEGSQRVASGRTGCPDLRVPSVRF